MPEQIWREGITRVSQRDILYAGEMGYRIKLLAIARLVEGQVEARVHPSLVHQGSMLASVNGSFNAVAGRRRPDRHGAVLRPRGRVGADGERGHRRPDRARHERRPRTFVHTRAGAAAGTFLLFAISVFGTMLLVPLYYQSVRGASALQAGLLMAPSGFGAMLLMPVAGRLTDRYGPTWLPVSGLPLVAIGLIPFVFVGAHTSYVLLGFANFVQGLGMGLAMMPNMTAAMQAVPPSAIARTSTAMNIIRQAGASIGTAVLSVILASAITSNLSSILGHRATGSGGGGIATLQHLPAGAHAAIARPLADAFASTFLWALVLILIALIPAAGMALSGWRRPVTRPAGTGRVLAE